MNELRELDGLEQRIKDEYTFVKPCCVDDTPDAHTAWLKIDHQSFCITHLACDTKDEADWYCRQAAMALARMGKTLFGKEGR